jgi:alpha-L-fucosidase
MRLGFYYSPPDMHHPGYRDTSKPVPANWLGEPKRPQWGSYLDYMESHLRKLLTDYGEISVIWFDGLVGYNKYDPQRMQRVVRELSPATLINDRLGWQFDYITPEQFIPRQGIPVRAAKPPAQEKGGEGLFKAVPALLKTPLIGGWLRKQLDRYAEGSLELTKVPQEPAPAPQAFQPWETCMTMGTTWAFNPVESRWKSPETLVRNLVEVASRGGNLLLNVGPTAEGEFPPKAVERLRFIASWMEHHQDAIHDTTYAPPLGWVGGRATRRGDALFLHLFELPAEGKVVIEALPGKAKSAAWLNGARLAFSQVESRLEIALPAPQPEDCVNVIHLELEAA